MKALEDLKEMLEDEIKKITKKGDITPTELDNAYKAIDIIKDIETIDAMKEYGSDSPDMEYSQRGGMYRNSYGYSQNRGNYTYSPNPMSNNSNNQGNSNNSYDGSYNGSYDGNYNSYDGRAGRDADNDGRYSEDSSYRRGRDAMGRYTSRDGSYRGYSRHEAKEAMMKKLETMMSQATTEKERQAIQNCMEELGA